MRESKFPQFPHCAVAQLGILGFSDTCILREINFGECRISKTAVFTIFRRPEFCTFGKRQPSKRAKFRQTN